VKQYVQCDPKNMHLISPGVIRPTLRLYLLHTHCYKCIATEHWHHYSCLAGAAVRCQTRDRKVASSTLGQGAIKSTRSTQPSIPPSG